MDDLRAAASVLRAAGLIAVADAVARALAGVPLDEAFGFKPGAGHRKPLTVDRLRRRDTELRALREAHFDDMPNRQAAERIGAAWQAYARRALRADRTIDAMPESYRDTPREYLWRIARLPAEIPGGRSLQTILAGRKNETSYPYSFHTGALIAGDTDQERITA